MNNTDKPKVCVVMPVYNGEKTINYAISSLLRQTYENWVCIIVNDGSTDNTRTILDSITDSRFHIYHLDSNKGRGYARDVALSHSNGKYLAYLDADDMIHKDKLKVQVKYLEENPEIVMVGCGCITYNENFEALRVNNLNSFQSSNNMQYGQVLSLLPGTIMIRLDHAKRFNYNHYLDVGEDYDYFARCCNGYKYANIGKPYYYYQTGNVSAKKLFYYQFNSLKIVFVTWKSGLKFLAIKRFLKKIFKIIAYSILIPLVGVKRIVNYRNGQQVSNNELTEYTKELSNIRLRK